MIYFRCDVGENAGWGHLKRCMALAQSIKQTQMRDVCFFIPEDMVFGKPTLPQMIEEIGAEFLIIPASQSYAAEIAFYPETARNIIVDLGHRKNLENKERLNAYLKALDQKGYEIVLIDGLDDDSFNVHTDITFMAVVQPYWGFDAKRPPKADHWYYGQDYLLIDNRYKNAYVHKKNNHIENILITFGGSDPQGITKDALKGALAFANASIKVVIGASFSTEHESILKKIVKDRPNVELIYSPSLLLNYYKWADVCLCGSGTSRFEAMVCGVPVVFVSIYPEHQNLSERFARYKTSLYLGYYKHVSSNEWTQTLSALQDNPNRYIKLIGAIAKSQPKGWGTDNLSKAIVECFS